MNEMQPLRRWAIGTALCLSLTHGPLGSSPVYANATPLQQALTQQVSAIDAQPLPVAEFYQLHDGQPAWQSGDEIGRASCRERV